MLAKPAKQPNSEILMTKALTVILSDGTNDGTKRKIYATAAGLATLKQPEDADFRRIKTVDVSPNDNFDPNEHYIVQVNETGRKRSAVVLFGITPEWLNAFLDTLPSPEQFGAVLIADDSMNFNPGAAIFV